MAQERWMWNSRLRPGLRRVIEDTPGGLEWCVRIEKAPGESVTGKVLCVCIAVAIVREALALLGGDAPLAAAALELLDHWIDDPTDERFDRICSLIFGEGSPEFDPHGVVWWALRTATSPVGNDEAGWALQATCDSAVRAGLSVEALRKIAGSELRARCRLG